MCIRDSPASSAKTDVGRSIMKLNIANVVESGLEADQSASYIDVDSTDVYKRQGWD